MTRLSEMHDNSRNIEVSWSVLEVMGVWFKRIGSGCFKQEFCIAGVRESRFGGFGCSLIPFEFAA